MLRYTALTVIFLIVVLTSSYGQTHSTGKTKERIQQAPKKNANPLMCDPKTGLCERHDSGTRINAPVKRTGKALKVLYFTDPICSSCWGIEPQLRKLKLEYGNDVEIEYHMGGLLKDWSYNVGGISKPSDVAHHWDEVSIYYDMPIIGDVWLEDPLASSYPPSIAFKAAQLQDKTKAIVFLRELREMVFLHKKNIAKWEHIAAAAKRTGLNTAQLKKDMDGRAKQLFEEDLKLSRQYGVRGFPTMFFINGAGKQEVVYGSEPYAAYEAALLKTQPSAVRMSYDRDWKALFARYNTLTAKEFAALSGIARADCDKTLDQLVQTGALKKTSTRNGALWGIVKQ